jgi:hypothetical protein
VCVCRRSRRLLRSPTSSSKLSALCPLSTTSSSLRIWRSSCTTASRSTERLANLERLLRSPARSPRSPSRPRLPSPSVTSSISSRSSSRSNNSVTGSRLLPPPSPPTRSASSTLTTLRVLRRPTKYWNVKKNPLNTYPANLTLAIIYTFVTLPNTHSFFFERDIYEVLTSH